MLRSKLSRSWIGSAAWLVAAVPLVPASLLTVLVVSTAVRADDAKVSGEVTVVLAKEAEGEYDAKLKQLPALQKPPFNGFKSMKVLSTTPVELGADKTPTVALPNGRTLQLKLVEKMADGRHKVQVAINRPGKQDYLPLLTVIASGEPFFVAGQSFEGGTLVIGVRVGGAPSAAAPAAAPKK
jgi:hypothetical protein